MPIDMRKKRYEPKSMRIETTVKISEKVLTISGEDNEKRSFK